MKEPKDIVRSHFSNEETVQLWEKLYRKNKNFFAYAMSARKKTIIDILKKEIPRQNDRLLDLGCGAGVIGKELVELGFNVVGMDISLGMAKQAESNLGSNNLTVGDVEKIPFADGTFDRIVCLGVITYLPDERKAIGEMYRILKPGGQLIIAVRNKLELARFADVPKLFYRLAGRMLGKKNSSPAKHKDERTKHSKTTNSSAKVENEKPFYHRTFVPWKLSRSITNSGFMIESAWARGFGPFTCCNCKLMSLRASIFVSDQISRLSEQKPFGFLKNFGLVSIWKVTKPLKEVRGN